MASRREGSWETPAQLRSQLQSMDEYEFEHLIADLWREQGWEADVEQQSRDAGIDVRARKKKPYPRKVLIQAKRYSDDNPVGGSDIQQYYSLQHQERNVDEVIVVTTGRFTSPAEDRAQDLNVKTLDGDDLVDLIDHLDAYDVVSEYITPPERTPSPSTTSTTSTTSDATDGYQTDDEGGQEQDLDRETRREIKRRLINVTASVEVDPQDFIHDEWVQLERAVENYDGFVKINPKEAKQIRVFEEFREVLDDGDLDSTIEEVFSRRFDEGFSEEAWTLVYLKDDVHVNPEGYVLVEDLTEYVPAEYVMDFRSRDIITGSGTIAAAIEPGIPDGQWMSDLGKNALSDSKRQKRFVSWFSRLGAEYNKGKREALNFSTSDSTTTTGTEAETEAAGNKPEGYYTVVAGTLGWLSSILLMGLVGHPLVLLIPLVCWLILPVGLLMDGKQSGLLSASRTNGSILPQVEVSFYVLLSLIPWIALLPGLAYLYRRHRLLGE